jgi:hypothetical protein
MWSLHSSKHNTIGAAFACAIPVQSEIFVFWKNFDFEFHLLRCEYVYDRAFGVLHAELYGHPRHICCHQWSKLLHASTRLSRKRWGLQYRPPGVKGLS